MLRIITAISFFLLLTAPAGKAQDRGPCSRDSLYLMMDFWEGEWWVTDTLGTLTGSNRIEKILDDCALQEQWLSVTGTAGLSLFYVDGETREWKQVWVTNNARAPGGQQNKTLVYVHRDRSLVFQGSYKLNGKVIFDRTILQPHHPDLVLQTIEISEDYGKTWKKTFTGIYIRKGSSFDIYSGR